MQQTKKKIARIQRLREIEQSKLNQLAVGLNEVELRLTEQMQQLRDLQDQIDHAPTSIGGSAVDKLQQMSLWIQYSQLGIDIVQQAITETESQRDEMIQRVVDQKSTVRGWESLIDRLQDDVVVGTQKMESLVADDRFLSSRMGR